MEIITDSKEYDFFWRVLLLGSRDVGKSTLCKRIKFKNYNKFMEFEEHPFSFINTDCAIIYIKYLNKKFKLMIWNIAGKERDTRFTYSYLKICSIYLIFYDAFNRQSFNTLKNYIDSILSIDEKRIIMIARNKYELKLESKENNIDIISDEEVLEYISNKNTNENIFFFHLSNYEKYESGINNLLEFIIIKSIKKNLKCNK